MGPTFSAAPSSRTPDESAVLHPVPDRTPPAWLSRGLRWSPVGVALVVSLMWLELFSWPGGPHPFVLIPLVLVLFGLAVVSLALVVEWLRNRSRSVPVPALLVGVLVVATLAATWLGVPLEVRFESNRAELDRVVEQLHADPPSAPLPPGQLTTVEVGSYGTLTVSEVPGGWHFATPSPGDRAGVLGFAHLDDASAAAWPEGVAIRPLGGNWYLAELPG